MAEQLEFSFNTPGVIPLGYVSTDYLYASAGGPSDDWWELAIVDLETGEEINYVTEVCLVTGRVTTWIPNTDQQCLRVYKNIAICKRVV